MAKNRQKSAKNIRKLDFPYNNFPKKDQPVSNALKWVPSGLKWHQRPLKWVKRGSRGVQMGSHAAQRGQNGLKIASNTPKWPFPGKICLSPHRRGSTQHSKMGGAGTGTLSEAPAWFTISAQKCTQGTPLPYVHRVPSSMYIGYPPTLCT